MCLIGSDALENLNRYFQRNFELPKEVQNRNSVKELLETNQRLPTFLMDRHNLINNIFVLGSGVLSTLKSIENIYSKS